MTIEQHFYGELGVLAYDSINDKVQCHICGKWFRGLNAHVWQTHGWFVDDYREEFGLNRGQGLICEGTRTKLSEINKELGNWKHLISQTDTKDDLLEFLRIISPGPGKKLRTQALLLKSRMLKEYNPMNEPEVQQRRIETQKKTWYGSPRMRQISSVNLKAVMATIRKRNIEKRKYTCPCGEAFPIRKEGEHHRAKCSVARQQTIKRQQAWRSLRTNGV